MVRERPQVDPAALLTPMGTPTPSPPMATPEPAARRQGKPSNLSRSDSAWSDAEDPKKEASQVVRRFWATAEDGGALLSIFTSNPVGVLFVFLPFAFLSYYLSWGDTAVFWFNFFALIPLAALLGDVVEEVAKHTNATVAGLLNASLGNFPEMIVSVQALRLGETWLAQASLVGSVLSNSLLVAGTCIVAANWRRQEVVFSREKALQFSSLLMLGCLGVDVAVGGAADDSTSTKLLSRLMSLLLVGIYACLLVFQLKTHRDYVAADEEGEGEDDDEAPKLSLLAAVLAVTAVMTLTTLMADYVVASVEGMIDTTNLSESFTGAIVLPIAGNVVEHLSALTIAFRGKLDLALAISMGSAAQVATFVLPFSVVVGWIMGVDMDLDIPTMATVILNMTVVLLTFTILTGRTQWLKGAALIVAYAMAALAFLAQGSWS